MKDFKLFARVDRKLFMQLWKYSRKYDRGQQSNTNRKAFKLLIKLDNDEKVKEILNMSEEQVKQFLET